MNSRLRAALLEEGQTGRSRIPAPRARCDRARDSPGPLRAGASGGSGVDLAARIDARLAAAAATDGGSPCSAARRARLPTRLAQPRRGGADRRAALCWLSTVPRRTICCGRSRRGPSGGRRRWITSSYRLVRGLCAPTWCAPGSRIRWRCPASDSRASARPGTACRRRVHAGRAEQPRGLGADGAGGGRTMNLDRMKRYATDDVVDAVVIGTGAGARRCWPGWRGRVCASSRSRPAANWTRPTSPPTRSPAPDLLDRRAPERRCDARGVRRQQQRHRRRRLDAALGRVLPAARPARPQAAPRPGQASTGPSSTPSCSATTRRSRASSASPAPRTTRGTRAGAIRSRRCRSTLRPSDAARLRRDRHPHRDCPAAVLSRDVPGAGGERQRCINCGYCHQGCRNGAKASMDVTYLPLAVAAGAEIRAECRVHGFERDGAAGSPPSSIATRTGRSPAALRAAVPCAGAVETPRLLLHTGVGQRQRAGRAQLHGPCRDAGLGHVRRRNAAATRAIRRRSSPRT